MTPKTLKIGSLLLDQNNPRIPATGSQREALQQVIDDQEEKLANMADSIVDEGLSKFGIEPMTPRKREASDRLYERCMEVSKELAPVIDEACGGEQRKLWTVIGSAHWELAFVALAMMHSNEDEFVRAMKSQPASEADLRSKHRELHDQHADECGAVYDIHLFS